jgi:hypothetical protein
MRGACSTSATPISFAASGIDLDRYLRQPGYWFNQLVQKSRNEGAGWLI